jgi:hypothetical protein
MFMDAFSRLALNLRLHEFLIRVPCNRLCDFVDTVPSSPGTSVYLANSSKFGVCGSETTISEPQTSDQQVTWSGLYAVPASSNRCLKSGDVSLARGVYTNSALGRIASTGIYIGTTGSTAATADITVLSPDLTISKTSGTFTQAQTAATYNLSVSNGGTLASSPAAVFT